MEMAVFFDAVWARLGLDGLLSFAGEQTRWCI